LPLAITATMRFRASHSLRMYDGRPEPQHEHEWRVKLTVGCSELDGIGVVMDFHDLERRLETILGPLRGTSLNDFPAFARINPSAENVAIYISQALKLPETVTLEQVEVWETPDCSALWRGGVD
jgi:6-pyruvoyltetrahydropterin/6-carboxytetrahydropterin synthase